MYPRINYEMTEAQKDRLLAACKPVPMIMIGGYAPSSPQENANRAWEALGAEMGFDYMTVQPIPGKGMLHFSAVPSENETQRAERIAKEENEKKAANIKSLEAEVKAAQERLADALK